MLNLPLGELLDVWSELVLALCGQNEFGGDVAELYAHRFQRRNPPQTENGGETAKQEDALTAA